LASISPVQRDRATRAGSWFGLLAVLVFCGEGLGYAACLVAGGLPPQPVAWVAFALVALVVGGVGAVLLNWFVLQPLEQVTAELEAFRAKALAGEECRRQLAGRVEQQRRMRHDIRGALSPALLTADRLLGHADPVVKRAADIMVRAVERSAALLADPAVPDPPGS
jgi:hypothetical protein